MTRRAASAEFSRVGRRSVNRSFKTGDVVYHERLGRGTIVQQWGCWTAVEPDSGKPATINGASIYEVEFETGRLSVNGCWLSLIDCADASVLERT
jgi:hypothetical protein